MNSVILIGRLTDKPEVSYTQSQKAVAKFTLAVDRKGEGADFIRITAWDRQAENAGKYLHKGSKCAVNGRIQTGSYQKDGKTVYTTDVVAFNVEFLDSKPQESKTNEPTYEPTYDDFSGSFEPVDGYVPF